MFRKFHFKDEERLRGWRENFETERIRGKDLGQIHIRKFHFKDEERLRGAERDFGMLDFMKL
jgi:hypothetical protein